MSSVREYKQNVEMVKRRRALAHRYNALPAYASPAFWTTVEAPDIPLEVLTRSLRMTIADGDDEGRNRLLEAIFARIQTSNEYWAQSVLQYARISGGERSALASDLCSELCESVMRALLDPQRLFWEENFQHCLHFERKHVYCAFMRHEGHWYDPQVKRAMRIPRIYITSLDQALHQENGGTHTWDVEDEQAQMLLQVVESGDLLQFVLQLPDQFKAVVLLIFWEGRSEKEAAQVLGVTDRTVRNWLRKALHSLHTRVTLERERFYG